MTGMTGMTAARPGLALVALAGLSLSACVSGTSGSEGAARAGEPQRAASTSVAEATRQSPSTSQSGSQVASQPASQSGDEPATARRVLVTGFNDWHELGDPPQLWRCRDNPSCRLLLGAVHDQPPQAYTGPLVERLLAASSGEGPDEGPSLEWRFLTAPVVWEAYAEVPRDVDVIVYIGLGVYDRSDVLQLEAGAYNLREGSDARGQARPGPIDAEAGEILAAPPDSPISARLAALAGRRFADYELRVSEARRGNSYLCNETHYQGLAALHEADGPGERLREVYFLHIPAARNGDYASLADGVAQLILALVGPEAGGEPSGE